MANIAPSKPEISTCKTDSSGVITCKAAVAWKSSEPLMVEEIQVDPPKSGEVRIKMLYASVCHTDTVYWTGYCFPFFPRIFGHEGVGLIESVGDNVTNLEVGDTVMPLYLGECGECSNCTSGKTNLCNRYYLGVSGLMADGTSRMSVKGQKIFHLFNSSTWSEYIVIESSFVVKVDPRISLPHACLLCCGFTTGYGSAWKELKVEKGSTVAILGLGAVGLGVAKACQIIGATKIIGVDINEMRREKAKAFGVTDFINPKHYDKPTPELIKEANGGQGLDYCFECSGVPSLLNQALESTKPGLGQVAFVSGGVQRTGEISYVLLSQGRTVKGTYFGGVKIHSDLPKLVEKCVNKEIDLDELITHEISLAEINKGFLEYMKQPDCVKVIIKF